MKRLCTLSVAFALTIGVYAGGTQEGVTAPKQVTTDAPTSSDKELALAKGPNGETAVRAKDIVISDTEIAKIRAGKYKAAMLWAGSGEWYNALTAGAEAMFAQLGIAVVSKAEAGFDMAKQATDVETCLALNPNIILTLVVDPVSGARAFTPAVKQGVTLVFADNGVTGYQAGREYVSIVTGDHFGMGRAAAELINEAVGGKGNIGFIFHDADYFVTNNRDGEFKRTVRSSYPGLKIVAEAGFTEEGKTEEIASAMLTRNPEINAIYVAWDVAAEGVVSALRAAGRSDVKVVTHDLGATLDLDMAMGGNLYGKVADLPYDIGMTMAKAAALKLVGKNVPPFIVVPYIKMTRKNIVEAWNISLRKNPPNNILKALK